MPQSKSKSKSSKPQSTSKKKPYLDTPFSTYFRQLDEFDKGLKYSEEFGSFLILSLVEEVGEMARAYLAKHGRKGTNLAAQADETYEQELGDLLLTILRFARIKNIDLDERLSYSIDKVRQRRQAPKPAK